MNLLFPYQFHSNLFQSDGICIGSGYGLVSAGTQAGSFCVEREVSKTNEVNILFDIKIDAISTMVLGILITSDH